MIAYYYYYYLFVKDKIPPINTKMAGLSMIIGYNKYTTSLPFYGMWGSRKTSWDGPANKKDILIVYYQYNLT